MEVKEERRDLPNTRTELALKQFSESLAACLVRLHVLDLHAPQCLGLVGPWERGVGGRGRNIESGDFNPEAHRGGQVSGVVHDPLEIRVTEKAVLSLDKGLSVDVAALPQSRSRDVRARLLVVDDGDGDLAGERRECIRRDVVLAVEGGVCGRVVGAFVLSVGPEVTAVSGAAIARDFDLGVRNGGEARGGKNGFELRLALAQVPA